MRRDEGACLLFGRSAWQFIPQNSLREMDRRFLVVARDVNEKKVLCLIFEIFWGYSLVTFWDYVFGISRDNIFETFRTRVYLEDRWLLQRITRRVSMFICNMNKMNIRWAHEMWTKKKMVARLSACNIHDAYSSIRPTRTDLHVQPLYKTEQSNIFPHLIKKPHLIQWNDFGAVI